MTISKSKNTTESNGNGTFQKVKLYLTSAVLGVSLAMNAYFLKTTSDTIDKLVLQTNSNTTDITLLKKQAGDAEKFIEHYAKPHVFADDTYVKPQKIEN